MPSAIYHEVERMAWLKHLLTISALARNPKKSLLNWIIFPDLEKYWDSCRLQATLEGGIGLGAAVFGRSVREVAGR